MTRIFFVILCASAIALSTARPTLADDKFADDTYRQLELFGNVFERVRKDYVEDVSDQDLIEAAINGMLTSLDPHSSFLSAKSFEDMQEQTKGEFGGLGIEVTLENGFVKVVSPIDDTPAYDAGLQPGDYITGIDGDNVLGLTLGEAVEMMRGPVDTDITITIRREGVEAFDVTLTRAVIQIRSVRHRVEGDVGYLRVTSFTEQTQVGLENSIESIKNELGGLLKGYVLDLRSNPGGLLDQAVSVTDTFLDRGEIVSTRTRYSEETERRTAKKGDLTDGLPIVVLINDGSASASEIVAGALQDHGRAIILGTKSFGKGSVQTIIPMQDSSAMRLTTARYYTPSGRSIQGTGIEPDILVVPATVERLAARNRRSESSLRGALTNDTLDDDVPETETAGERTTEDVDDYQLARALDLIQGLALYRQNLIN
ncbi:MAG: S41 family peptidase [Rhodospirillaceae bacterium]|jgi:carboxyl-terminal processing protease|nr:S41 family peptidase [Rhodospirillaceae bacterium]